MEELLKLLKGNNTRTTEEMAVMLNTSVADINRKLEYLEKIGAIQDESLLPTANGCGNCNGCNGCDGSSAACKGCIPPDAGKNMGRVWKVLVNT